MPTQHQGPPLAPTAPAAPEAPAFVPFGGIGKIIPFEICQQSEIAANVVYEEESNTLRVNENTLKDCIGSWLQSRSDSVGALFDVRKFLRTKTIDIKKINSIDSFLGLLKTFVSKLVQIKVPLYQSTADLNDDVSAIVTSFIEGKVDEDLLDGDCQTLVGDLVSRTIKPGTVERERLDYVATQFGRNLGSSGQKDQIKQFTTMLGRYVNQDELRIH